MVQQKLPNFRRAEVYYCGEWHEVPMSHIRKGNRFRLFELDGTPVVGKDNAELMGETEFVALKDAGKTKYGDISVSEVKAGSWNKLTKKKQVRLLVHMRRPKSPDERRADLLQHIFLVLCSAGLMAIYFWMCWQIQQKNMEIKRLHDVIQQCEARTK